MNRPPSYLSLVGDDLRPMTREETEGMVSVMLARRDESVAMSDDSPLAAERGWNAIGVANTSLRPRLSLAGVCISEPLFMLVCIWAGGSPGDVVGWAYTLLELARKTGNRHLTTDDLVYAFPMGIPTEEARQRIWDAQKHFDGAQDNWLDQKSAWTLEAVPA